MNRFKVIFPILFLLINVNCSEESESNDSNDNIAVNPPFQGTIFLDPDIIIASDPSTFESLSYAGQDTRTMFDRRENDWVTNDPFLFNAKFDDGLTAEIQVNSEFETEALAEIEAVKYATAIGQLPTSLREDVETVWIHKGVELFGGGNNNILIHTGQSVNYENDGILEETLVHEATHTSLDNKHADSEGWKAAQEADPTYISTYARDNPTREDVAETFLLYMAIRYRADRISESLNTTINESIPNRIEYLDNQTFKMYPIE